MKEAVFCSNMLTEIGFGKDFAKVPLYCDNAATLHTLKNRSFSSRTKHIALRFFFIRELVSVGRISIRYIPTDINPADIDRHKAPKQGSLQEPAGHHQQLQRERLYQQSVHHQQPVQLVVLYVCVFVFNLLCLCESTCSFCNRHSASHHH